MPPKHPNRLPTPPCTTPAAHTPPDKHTLRLPHLDPCPHPHLMQTTWPLPFNPTNRLLHVCAPIQQQPCHGLMALLACDPQWRRPISRLLSPNITPRQHPSPHHRFTFTAPAHYHTRPTPTGAPYHATPFLPNIPPHPTPQCTTPAHPINTLFDSHTCIPALTHNPCTPQCPLPFNPTNRLLHVRAPIQQQPCHGLVALLACNPQWCRPIRRLHSPSNTARQHPSSHLHLLTPHNTPHHAP
jgi:hypothetical protein